MNTLMKIGVHSKEDPLLAQQIIKINQTTRRGIEHTDSLIESGNQELDIQGDPEDGGNDEPEFYLELVDTNDKSKFGKIMSDAKKRNQRRNGSSSAPSSVEEEYNSEAERSESSGGSMNSRESDFSELVYSMQ